MGGLGGVVMFVAACASTMVAARPAADPLPPEKAALETFAANHRATAPRRDKSTDAGRPTEGPPDEPPDTGLLGPANAPVPGGVFTPVNAWAGWTDPSTYTQVYVGDSPERQGEGLVFVVRRPGVDGVLTPGAEPVTTFITPPAVGGPLRIVRVEGQELIVANRGGHEFRFNPADAAFD
jgi:hypothetical protein